MGNGALGFNSLACVSIFVTVEQAEIFGTRSAAQRIVDVSRNLIATLSACAPGNIVWHSSSLRLKRKYQRTAHLMIPAWKL